MEAHSSILGKRQESGEPSSVPFCTANRKPSWKIIPFLHTLLSRQLLNQVSSWCKTSCPSYKSPREPENWDRWQLLILFFLMYWMIKNKLHFVTGKYSYLSLDGDQFHIQLSQQGGGGRRVGGNSLHVLLRKEHALGRFPLGSVLRSLGTVLFLLHLRDGFSRRCLQGRSLLHVSLGVAFYAVQRTFCN